MLGKQGGRNHLAGPNAQLSTRLALWAPLHCPFASSTAGATSPPRRASRPPAPDRPRGTDRRPPLPPAVVVVKEFTAVDGRCILDVDRVINSAIINSVIVEEDLAITSGALLADNGEVLVDGLDVVDTVFVINGGATMVTAWQ
ncbi:hypothetical protein NDU88_005983 [Pleurodeles waltl]|uniref:Uncharacterized protein n=1 Tax=Pleurodeles waltl TaxID=8319 RepID=A0AAV7WC88_PLEWA|nr:hypothetical protein NDU88_005983 [Pleurodeles waltl]